MYTVAFSQPFLVGRCRDLPFYRHFRHFAIGPHGDIPGQCRSHTPNCLYTGTGNHRQGFFTWLRAASDCAQPFVKAPPTEPAMGSSLCGGGSFKAIHTRRNPRAPDQGTQGFVKASEPGLRPPGFANHRRTPGPEPSGSDWCELPFIMRELDFMGRELVRALATIIGLKRSTG